MSKHPPLRAVLCRTLNARLECRLALRDLVIQGDALVRHCGEWLQRRVRTNGRYLLPALAREFWYDNLSLMDAGPPLTIGVFAALAVLSGFEVRFPRPLATAKGEPPWMAVLQRWDRLPTEFHQAQIWWMWNTSPKRCRTIISDGRVMKNRPEKPPYSYGMLLLPDEIDWQALWTDPALHQPGAGRSPSLDELRLMAWELACLLRPHGREGLPYADAFAALRARMGELGRRRVQIAFFYADILDRLAGYYFPTLFQVFPGPKAYQRGTRTRRHFPLRIRLLDPDVTEEDIASMRSLGWVRFNPSATSRARIMTRPRDSKFWHDFCDTPALLWCVA